MLSRGASRDDIVTLETGLLDLDAQAVAPPSPAGLPPEASPDIAPGITLRDAVADCQRRHIQAALAIHQDNWAQTARTLGLDASNLHKLARRLGLK